MTAAAKTSSQTAAAARASAITVRLPAVRGLAAPAGQPPRLLTPHQAAKMNTG
jgi:hypothetical protein